VLLVDTWTLKIERYRELLRTFDQSNYLNTSVLVLWDSDTETVDSQEALDQLVKATFYFRLKSQEARMFVSPIKTVDEFRRELADALEATRRRIREHADLMRKVANKPRPIL
jgi:FxsC-like protein